MFEVEENLKTNYMYKDNLVTGLISSAKSYGFAYYGNVYINPNENVNSSIIFNDIKYNFHPKSWEVINKNDFYKSRTIKKHSKTITSGLFEMQSSNSSDALAMNIFCHPDVDQWKGLKDLLDIESFKNIDFGFMAKVLKIKTGLDSPDKTEVDIYIKDELIGEFKLTEEGFTQKDKINVELYKDFTIIFHRDKLLQNQTHYFNYQLIRNILAAYQHHCRFILFCDMRRPDLARSFYQTVRCIKDDHLEIRTNCEIIYWQDIAQVVGDDLKDFLKEKYGII